MPVPVAETGYARDPMDAAVSVASADAPDVCATELVEPIKMRARGVPPLFERRPRRASGGCLGARREVLGTRRGPALPSRARVAELGTRRRGAMNVIFFGNLCFFAAVNTFATIVEALWRALLGGPK